MQTQLPNHMTEVYSANLHAELANIDHLIRSGFTHVSIDTEFPGLLYRTKFEDRSAAVIYNIMKSNVDKLKPIQFGLSLADAQGNRPTGVSTWQFNMRFDASRDTYDPKGMSMLLEAKIPLDRLAEDGIELAEFGSAVRASQLHANQQLTWLSFHGAYDFAYWVKSITLADLPDTPYGFNEIRKAACPVAYDVKMLIQSNERIMNYSLGKLTAVFGIEQKGILHQAGTDAFVTCELYFKVKTHLLGDRAKKFENKLYGLNKLFSMGSAEYETKSKKKSLLEKLTGNKTASSGQKILKSEVAIGVVLVPTFVEYGGYQGFGVSQLARGGKLGNFHSFHQCN